MIDALEPIKWKDRIIRIERVVGAICPTNMIQLWAQEKLFPLFNVSIFFLPENVI